MGLFTPFEKSDKPKFRKLKEEGCVVLFSVEVPAAKAQDETHNLLVRIQQRAKVPGFRPGKAPLDVVKKQFSGHAREEVVDELIRRHVPEALRELALKPVAVPAVENVSYEEGKPVRFDVRVEVAPEVAPKDYLKIPVQRKNYPVTEEMLAKRLEELREANARLDRAEDEAVGKSHYVVIDYAGFSGGKPLPDAKGDAELVDMSSEQTLAGLAEGLVGLKRGESKEIPVKLRGKDANLKVSVKEIKKKMLPALDAEFSKDLGFASLDELKAKLKAVMDEEGRAKTDREVTEQIEAALLKANRIPLPPSLVEAQLEHRLEQFARQLLGPSKKWPEKQLEELKAKLRPQAENDVRLSYLLPAIAEKEKIAALEEDIASELEKSLGGAADDAKKDELRKLFSERKEAVAGMIRERKTLALLKEKAAYTDAPA